MIRSKYLKQFSLLALAAFFMLATGSLAWAQTNPALFDLSTSSYTFTGFASGTTTTYPASMQGHNFSAEPTSATLTSNATGNQALVANSGVITSGSIRNEIANGISLLNSGSNNIGAIVIGINATGRNNIKVSFTAQQLNDTNTRVNGLRLQYRIGGTGAYTDVSPTTEYLTNLSGVKAAQTFTDIALPAAVDGQSEVYVRFIYYSSSGSGSRDRIRLDDITISSSAAAVNPTISINDVTAVEGNAGTTTFAFTVSLSAAAPAGGVTFDIATSNGTATAPDDYTSSTLTGQTIPAGQSSYTFNVLVNGDTTFEPNENFNVTLSNVTGAATTGNDLTGVGTITNDDANPGMPGTFSLGATTYTVSETGTSLIIAVNRTGGSDGVVTVTYTTANITATGGTACGGANVDYVGSDPMTNAIMFGNGETTRNITIPICTDSLIEGDETFTVNINTPTGGATVGSPDTATVTITDVPPPPDLTVTLSAPATVAVNGTLTYTIVFTNSGSATVAPFDATFTLPASGYTNAQIINDGAFASSSIDGATVTLNDAVLNAPGSGANTTTVTVQVTPNTGGTLTSGTAVADTGNDVLESDEANNTAAGVTTTVTTPAPIVINEVYPSGGNGGATYNADFIELYNTTSAPINLSGYSLQYAPTTGTFGGTTSAMIVLPNASIPAGGYFLVQASPTGTNGVAVPSPNFIAPTGNNIALGATGGNIALVTGTTAFATGTTCATAISSGRFVDRVGYGTTANCAEGTPEPAPANSTTSIERFTPSTDTNNNSNDFHSITPPTPTGTAASAFADLIMSLSAPASVTVNSTYTYNVTVENAAGAATATNVTANFPIPAGTTFVSATPSQGTYDPATGVFTVGTLAAGESATLNVTVMAPATAQTITTTGVTIDPNNTVAESNEANNTPAAAQTIVSAPTISISPATLPDAQENQAYSQTITATGGTAPYTYAVTAGDLPEGLALAADGTLSGTPTESGTFNFTVTATDNSGFTGSRAYTLVVQPAPDTEAPFIMYTPLTATNNTTEPERLIVANITDNNFVAQARIYYRKNEGAYVSAPCGSDGGYYCYITYSNVGGIASGDTISYFIAAVDDSGNISSNPFGATGTDIANLTPPEETNLYAVGTTTVPEGEYSYISVNTATLEGSITVTRELNLNGIVTVPAGESIFSPCLATISGAGSSAYIIGTYAKQFCSFVRPAERGIVGELYPVGTANGYSPVTVLVNSTAGGVLDITAKQGTQPNLSTTMSLKRYWTVNKTGGAFNADMTFQYLDADVAGTEADYKAIRIENGTAAFYTPFSLNAAANQITVSGVTNFSDWTAGESLLAPTAAAVTVGGRVTESNGRGIQRVKMTVTDSQGVVRTAYTNSMGFYRFEAVPAGETYVFSATHRRYRFEQPAQVRFISEDDANINFVSSIGDGLIDLTRPF